MEFIVTFLKGVLMEIDHSGVYQPNIMLYQCTLPCLADVNHLELKSTCNLSEEKEEY